MRAVAISKPGGPEVLDTVTEATPQPGPDEVLIEVAAAGVNRPDCVQRAGLYPPPPGASPLPGLEVAGRLVRCGAAVSGWQPGDSVCALLAGGGYAEYCVAPAAQCLPVPAGLTLSEAAALPETFFTVWKNVFELGRLRPDETLLVHGGASGIGTTAIQLAAAYGARVCATAGTADKVALCKALGATHVFNYRSADFQQELKTLGVGADVILDMVGGPYLEQNLRCLNPGGRLVNIGILGGAKGSLNLGLVLTRQLTVTGSTLRPRPVSEKRALAEQLLEHVWPWLEQGRVKPVIAQQLGLEAAATAHELLESSSVAGKIVLLVNPALAATVPAA